MDSSDSPQWTSPLIRIWRLIETFPQQWNKKCLLLHHRRRQKQQLQWQHCYSDCFSRWFQGQHLEGKVYSLYLKETFSCQNRHFFLVEFCLKNPKYFFYNFLVFSNTHYHKNIWITFEDVYNFSTMFWLQCNFSILWIFWAIRSFNFHSTVAISGDLERSFKSPLKMLVNTSNGLI